MKKGFIIGLTTGVVLTGASLVLANSQIQAILNNQIKVTLNGQVQEFKDETTNEIQYPITYKDRTYLPLRTVANLVGVDVDYDSNSNTAILESNTGDYAMIERLAKKALAEYDVLIMDDGTSIKPETTTIKDIKIYYKDDVEAKIKEHANDRSQYDIILEILNDSKTKLFGTIDYYSTYPKEYEGKGSKAGSEPPHFFTVTEENGDYKIEFATGL